jgi:hypothetical protein
MATFNILDMCLAGGVGRSLSGPLNGMVGQTGNPSHSSIPVVTAFGSMVPAGRRRIGATVVKTALSIVRAAR